ncbi:MAG: hypothetical protein QM324_04855 [Bacteroidota bacterium]|nr:hypothetical protein [Bacteroidota bacterium]
MKAKFILVSKDKRMDIIIVSRVNVSSSLKPVNLATRLKMA